MKRAVLLVGAGASLDYGAPSTTQLTQEIEHEVTSNEYMRISGGGSAFQRIMARLQAHLEKPDDVNFEHAYHCAHELIHTFSHSERTKNQFRPLLNAFLEPKDEFNQLALSALTSQIAETIYEIISHRCQISAEALHPLRNFLANLRESYCTRIYTTNYDDFILQAAPDLYTGFPDQISDGPKRFELEHFWQRLDRDCVFHLHGSVHLGFPRPSPEHSDIGDLYWYSDRSEALRYASFHGTDLSRMDGTSVRRTSILTGLDKLSRLQQRPFTHYYASFAQDVMRADVIYVIGSGLGDLHLNTYLREARRKRPLPPLIIVDRWPRSFLIDTIDAFNTKEIHLYHDLQVYAKGPFGGQRMNPSWTVAMDDSAAIWDRGFSAFLAETASHQEVLDRLFKAYNAR